MKLMCNNKIVAELQYIDNMPYMVLRRGLDFMDVPYGLFSELGTPEIFLDKITYEKFMDWVEDRCMPKERVDCDEVLKRFGFSEYNRAELTYMTQAVMTCQDHFWVDFEDGRGNPIKW